MIKNYDNEINVSKILENLNKTVEVEVVEETTSTNDYIKKYLDKEVFVVIAKSQTNGRGRLNRSFYSPSNTGLYLSLLIKPNSTISNSVKLTTYTAVVVAKAIESLINMPVQIKWVNDLFLNGKKICGVLTESSYNFEKNKLTHAVIGIGVNVYNGSFPLELKSIATSIEKESGIKVNINDLISKIINGLLNAEKEISSNNYLVDYKKRLFILGKKVMVVSGNDSYDATCLDVLENGALVVNKDGEIITVHAGDVSIRV
jgi:BirA family biotin operon repressor/biotin-[acetyl-CoA-carboxylase] ligase